MVVFVAAPPSALVVATIVPTTAQLHLVMDVDFAWISSMTFVLGNGIVLR
jgi:hypothetical protein